MLWIKSIFVFHGTYLMGVPGIKKRLFLLRHLLDNRSASYKRILKLRGRLDLVLRHAQDISQNKMDFSQAQVPLVEVYESSMIPKEEEEEEEEEEEDEMVKPENEMEDDDEDEDGDEDDDDEDENEEDEDNMEEDDEDSLLGDEDDE